jgi:hypothetical protein
MTQFLNKALPDTYRGNEVYACKGARNLLHPVKKPIYKRAGWYIASSDSLNALFEATHAKNDLIYLEPFCYLSTRNHRSFKRGWVSLLLLSPLSHGLGQQLQHRLGVLPPDAGIRDTDAVLEASLALLGYLLVACEWLEV